jgi:hypothetical protein
VVLFCLARRGDFITEENDFMKKLLFGSMAFFLGLNCVFALDLPDTHGCGFVAPNVSGYSHVGNPQIGEIVFDSSVNGFYGYTGSAWGSFAGGGGGSVTFHSPTIQRFTSSATYTPPSSPAPLYISVEAVGAGGGGGGSWDGGDMPAAGSGGVGGNTVFGSLITAGGGAAGKAASNAVGSSGSAGGTNTVSAGATPIFNNQGGFSQGSFTTTSTGQGYSGSWGGGNTLFPINGSTPGWNAASTPGVGIAGIANSGQGGSSGAASEFGNATGTGGGGGGYVKAIIASPSSVSITIGTGGAAGTAGGGAFAGGAGGSGLIVVTEYYQ